VAPATINLVGAEVELVSALAVAEEGLNKLPGDAIRELSSISDLLTLNALTAADGFDPHAVRVLRARGSHATHAQHSDGAGELNPDLKVEGPVDHVRRAHSRSSGSR